MVKKRKTGEKQSVVTLSDTNETIISDPSVGFDLITTSLEPHPHQELGTHSSQQTLSTTCTTNTSSSTCQSHVKSAPFKSPQFMSLRSASSSKKSRAWKNLKQMIASEKCSSGVSGVSYGALDSPASKRPCKKYSDVTGIAAKYKDPTSKLLYHNSDEFATITILSQDVINGYLELRKGNE